MEDGPKRHDISGLPGQPVKAPMLLGHEDVGRLHIMMNEVPPMQVDLPHESHLRASVKRALAFPDSTYTFERRHIANGRGGRFEKGRGSNSRAFPLPDFSGTYPFSFLF